MRTILRTLLSRARAAMAAAALLSGVHVISPAWAENRWGADYFPNVELTTQHGTKVRFYDDLLKGKSVAIYTIYTRCQDECPLETARMAQVQRLLGERMGKDIFFYSISIDPEHDTPQALKAFAEKFNIGPGWLFLTGKKEDIKLVVKKLGLSRGSDAANKDGHTPSLMVGNEPTGQWMRNSALDNPQFLAATISNFLGWRDLAPDRSYAEARPLQLDQGEYLFQSRCAACHTIGAGEKIGPDLLGVTTRRERAWLARYLREPDKMRAEGDPIATTLREKYKDIPMPNQNMGGADLAAVLSYLETQNRAQSEESQR
ncbi:MAG: SCO family protein [Pseudomonadota bacterium]